MAENVLTQALIDQIRVKNPDVAAVLDAILLHIEASSEAAEGTEETTPPGEVDEAPEEVVDLTLPPPENFAAVTLGRVIFLTWTNPDPARIHSFEVRSQLSDDTQGWDLSDFETRAFTNAAYLAAKKSGDYVFRVKSVDLQERRSVESAEYSLSISGPAMPLINAQVIDNNVILRWNDPATSFEVDEYELFREDVSIGTTRSQFAPLQEASAGDYKYGVQAIDVAGNASLFGVITARVRQPPDYVLEDDRVLTGVYENASDCPWIEGTNMFIAGMPTVSQADLYEANGWTTPQDQIDAGYPYGAQPTVDQVCYINPDHDYETEFGGVTVSALFGVEWLGSDTASGIITAAHKGKAAATDSFPANPMKGSSVFISNLRFLRSGVDVDVGDDKSFALVENYQVRLDVKNSVDSGKVTCNADDVNDPIESDDGTQVNFNLSFRDVKTIVLTPDGTSERYARVNFTDVADPTGFKVLLFDSSGTAIDGDVSWIARGIV